MRYDRRIISTALAFVTLALGHLAVPASGSAQQSAAAAAAAPLTRAQLDELRLTLERHLRRERGRLTSLQRQVDVATLYFRLRDVAHVDQVRFFGPPSESSSEPRAISALVFVPKSMDGNDRASLVIWQRADDELEIESWSDVPELRELLGRGVTVIAPTYQGAPEERLEAVRDYALDRYPFLDADRVEWRAPS